MSYARHVGVPHALVLSPQQTDGTVEYIDRWTSRLDFTGATFDGGSFDGATFSGDTVSFDMATFSGMMVEVTAYFGFTCTGSSDDGRERTITTPISPTYAAEILRLQEAGATEEDLHPVVTKAITESYFTDWGTRADGLRADFTHVQSIDFEF